MCWGGKIPFDLKSERVLLQILDKIRLFHEVFLKQKASRLSEFKFRTVYNTSLDFTTDYLIKTRQ